MKVTNLSYNIIKIKKYEPALILIQAMVPLLHIAVLLLFFIVVCSIIGLELYIGMIKKNLQYLQKNDLNNFFLFLTRNFSQNLRLRADK